MTEIVIGYPRVVRFLNAGLLLAATDKPATVTALPTVGDLLNYRISFDQDLTEEEYRLVVLVATGNENSDALVAKSQGYWKAHPQWRDKTAKALREGAKKVEKDKAGSAREKELAAHIETLTDQLFTVSEEVHQLRDFVMGMFTAEFSDTGPQETSVRDATHGTGHIH